MDNTIASNPAPTGAPPRGSGSPPYGRADGDAAASDRRSLSGLFSDLWRSTTTLVQEEVELAKADVSEKAAQAAHAGGAIAIGGGIAFAGFLVLLLAASNALALALPPESALWLAPLIVGAVALIVGLITLIGGRSRLKAGNLEPTRSMQSLRRDRQLVKEHMK